MPDVVSSEWLLTGEPRGASSLVRTCVSLRRSVLPGISAVTAGADMQFGHDWADNWAGEGCSAGQCAVCAQDIT
eukprot:gene7641-215_t